MSKPPNLPKLIVWPMNVVPLQQGAASLFALDLRHTCKRSTWATHGRNTSGRETLTRMACGCCNEH
eukprot:1161861-Pelagomonas_calceolata.AAC.5